MSLRRSYLSRRIVHRSFTFSKSSKDFKSPEIEPVDDSKEEARSVGINDCCGENGVALSGGSSQSAESSSSWSTMLPELLGEIIQRVEASEDKWPQRQNVVVCGYVCKRWRDIAREVVERSCKPGKITFPSSLKKFIDVDTMISPTVHARRSLCYLMCDQPDAALRDAMQAQCIYPDWSTAFYIQAVALAKLDIHKDAADMLNEAAMLEEKKQRGGKGS